MSAKKKAPSTLRIDEIAAEITDILAPNESDDKDATEVAVRSSVAFLRELGKKQSPLWGNKNDNEEALSDLLKNVETTQSCLAKIPAETLVLLSLKGFSEQVPTQAEQHEALERLEKITGVLGYLQARCKDLLQQQPGEHGLAGFPQRLVAEEAWRLMRYCNLKPASGVASSTYGMIANLLFEAATGEQDKDLQRACKSTLERAKRGEISEWRGDPLFKGRLPT